MCLNCVSNVDMAVVGGTAAVGLSRAGVRSTLIRFGLLRSRTRAEADLDAADYLTSIGIDSLAVLGVAPRSTSRDATMSPSDAGRTPEDLLALA